MSPQPPFTHNFVFHISQKSWHIPLSNSLKHALHKKNLFLFHQSNHLRDITRHTISASVYCILTNSLKPDLDQDKNILIFGQLIKSFMRSYTTIEPGQLYHITCFFTCFHVCYHAYIRLGLVKQRVKKCPAGLEPTTGTRNRKKGM